MMTHHRVIDMSDPEPYDVNYCFTVPSVLENDRVKLVPFIPRIHADEFLAQVQSSPHLYDYLPYGPFQTLEEFYKTFYDSRIKDDTGSVLFAVYNKNGKREILAGSLAYLNSSAPHLAVEIGHIVTFPAFQRTHVTSNAVGLLMHYALDPPSAGGLGLRRVFWQANALNDKSVQAAQRMGFQWEAILRWDRVLPLGKEKAGNRKGERNEDPRPGRVGRDTAMLSICWDDWVGGSRQRVDDVMARTI